MTVNPLKEGSSNLDTPHPFISLPPPTETMYKKTDQKGGKTDQEGGGGRIKEPLSRQRADSMLAPLAPNVHNNPPETIVK